MKAFIRRVLLVSLFILAANSSYGMTSQCGLMYLPAAGQVTFVHYVEWNYWEYWEPNVEFFVATWLESPIQAEISSSGPVGWGGSVLHWLDNPPDGFYSGGGYGAINGAPLTTCWYQGELDTLPAPGVSLILTPNPVVVGASVRADWIVTNAVSCIASGPAFPAPFNINPNGGFGQMVASAQMNHAGNYTVLCAASDGDTGSASANLDVKTPTVNITSAIIQGDVISVELMPAGISGNLVVTLGGGGGPQTIHSMTQSGGGTKIISFSLQTLPEGQYSSINASWTVMGQQFTNTFPFIFRNLGTYLHTQYNTPMESSCPTTTDAPVYITTNQCIFSTQSLSDPNVKKLKDIFRYQAALNGTAYSTNFNVIKYENLCMSQTFNPPADAIGYPYKADLGNTFRRDEIVSGVGTRPVNNLTVAAHEDHPFLELDDQIYIVGRGNRTVTDYCPDCSTNNFHHLDNYTTNTNCTGIPSLPDAIVIKLN